MTSALMCVCVREPTRFREACSKRTDFEAQELREMRGWLDGKNEEPVPCLKFGYGSERAG